LRLATPDIRTISSNYVIRNDQSISRVLFPCRRSFALEKMSRSFAGNRDARGGDGCGALQNQMAPRASSQLSLGLPRIRSQHEYQSFAFALIQAH
jgi:hypothetical protein